MTIEEFEEEVKQAYIANGWQPTNNYWFNIEYISKYKHKQIRIIRIADESIIYGYGTTFNECFANVLKVLKDD